MGVTLFFSSLESATCYCQRSGRAGVPRGCMLALRKRRSCRLAAAFPLCFDGLLQQIDKLWRVDLAPLAEGDAALGAFDDCVCLRAAALKGGEKIDESCRVCQQRRPFLRSFLVTGVRKFTLHWSKETL